MTQNFIASWQKFNSQIHCGPEVTLQGNGWCRLNLHISEWDVRSNASSWTLSPDTCHFPGLTFHCQKPLTWPYLTSRGVGCGRPRCRGVHILVHKPNANLWAGALKSTFVTPWSIVTLKFEDHWVGQEFSTLAAHWNYLGILKIQGSGPFPRDPNSQALGMPSRHQCFFFHSLQGILGWGRVENHRRREKSKGRGILTLILPESQFTYRSMAVKSKQMCK